MPRIDFALIGHSDTWEQAADIVSVLRGPERPPVPIEDIRDILPWIPPRTSSRVTARSLQGREVNGAYIDCFIPPDRLDARFLRENLARVRDAASYAIREGARVVTLGGFSSILIEGKADLLPSHPDTAFTTGNTLTVALIVRGIERALALAGRELKESSVLIVGASGDVGSGCARCLASEVRRLLLSARNPDRLKKFASEFDGFGSRVSADTDLARLAAVADVVVCAASTPASVLRLDALPDGAIICDAGYPKNLSPDFAARRGITFYGGLGEVSGGLRLDPDLLRVVYPYGRSNVAHGCLLEGILLAMDQRFEPFSSGRGLITAQRVAEMWSIAQKHGIGLPPLINKDGLADENMLRLRPEVSR